MLTKHQEKWINTLFTDKMIKIIPFDPTCKEKFEKVKSMVHSHIDKSIEVLHRGASNMGISGQDEIDIYIPVKPKDFNHLIPQLAKLFDTNKEIYEMERKRFATNIDGKHIDVFLVNEEHISWVDNAEFDNRVRNNPDLLEKYKQMKELGDGSTVQEYYRKKTEFINEVLERTSED